MHTYDWFSVIRFNIFAFKWTGIWPEDDEYKLDLYLLRGISITFLFAFIQTATQTYLLLTNITDMQIVAGTSFLVISVWLIMMKMFYVARNIKTLRGLLATLNEDLFQLTNSEQVDLFTPSLKSWKLTYNMLAGSIGLALVFWTIDSFRRRRLPFLSLYPYDTTVSPLFELTCIHQIATLSFAAYSNVNLDTFIAAFNFYAGAQLDILCDNLVNIRPENFSKSLAICVRHHIEIIKFVNSYNKTFNWIILVQFFSSAASFGITMFLVVGVSPMSSDFYSFLFYANAVLLEIFIHCWFGNELQTKSSRIFVVAFETQWIDASSEAIHELIFFMLRTKTCLKHSALGLFELSLENFLRIIKTGYTYFALVTRFNSKE